MARIFGVTNADELAVIKSGHLNAIAIEGAPRTLAPFCLAKSDGIKTFPAFSSETGRADINRMRLLFGCKHYDLVFYALWLPSPTARAADGIAAFIAPSGMEMPVIAQGRAGHIPVPTRTPTP